jgi:hypothetical protein
MDLLCVSKADSTFKLYYAGSILKLKWASQEILVSGWPISKIFSSQTAWPNEPTTW